MKRKKLSAVVLATCLALVLSTFSSTNVIGANNSEKEKGHWKLVWSDEFNGDNGTAADKDNWNYEIGNGNDGWGNKELEYYTDSTKNVFQRDGNLIIKAQKESNRYTSGRIKTSDKFSMKYGKIEVKAKLPTGTGLWPAIWMMPQKDIYGGWAASGEIDIMENRGRLPNEVYGTIHYGGAWPNNKYSGSTYKFPQGQSVSDFHTYSIEWEPGEIRWYVDGKLYQTQNNWYTTDSNGEKYSYPAPFDQNFYIILNLALGGNFDGGKFDPSAVPAEMAVDYVRAYKFEGKPYSSPVEPKFEVEPLPAGAKQPTTDGNLLSNGDFSQPIQDNAAGTLDFADKWNFVHATDTGNGTQSIDNIDGKNYGKFNITSGGQNNYSVQLIQQTTLGKGRWYKVSFDAKASSNRTIGMKAGSGPDLEYMQYSDMFTFNLTSEFAHFEKYFQMTANSDIKARLEFELGLNTNTVWIGNVRLEEQTVVPKLPLNNGNLIHNGAFDKGNVDRMTYWSFNTNKANAAASVDEASRELFVKIKNAGKSPEAVTLEQKEIELQKDGTYKLKFKARADASRTIKVDFLSGDGKTTYASKVFSITTEMKEYVFSFKMNSANDINSKVTFKFGGNKKDVYLDDVSLFKEIDYSKINVYPLKNGDFSNGLYCWTSYSVDSGDAKITADSNQAKVSITSLGPTYGVMLNQENFSLAKNIEYILAFDVRATKTRNMEAVIDNASYSRYVSKTIEAPSGNQMKHYEFTFKIDKDDIVSLKFLMGKTDANVPITTHDIFIDNVVLEVTDAPVKRPPTLLPDTTENKVGQGIEVNFTDDETWRNCVKSVKVNGQALTTEKYKLTAGKLTLTADSFLKAGTYNILVEAEGYADTSVSQSIFESSGNIVLNGSFDENINGWQLYTGDGSNAAVTVNNGKLMVDFPNYDGWFRWSTQVYQNQLKLEAGKNYELSFDAYSTIAKEVLIEITKGTGGNHLAQQSAALTTENQSFKYDFTVTGDADLNSKVNFLLGSNNIPGENFVKHTIFIDNVVLKEKTVN